MSIGVCMCVYIVCVYMRGVILCEVEGSGQLYCWVQNFWLDTMLAHNFTYLAYQMILLFLCVPCSRKKELGWQNWFCVSPFPVRCWEVYIYTHSFISPLCNDSLSTSPGERIKWDVAEKCLTDGRKHSATAPSFLLLFLHACLFKSLYFQKIGIVLKSFF